MLLTFIPCIVVQAENHSNIKIGDYVQMGTYYGEPILWRCVSFEKIIGYDEGNPIMDATDTVTEYREGYLPLMISHKILCFKPFDASGSNITGSHGREGEYYISDSRISEGSNYWRDSNLRCWLNSSQSAGNIIWSCGNPPNADAVRTNDYANEDGFLTNFLDAEREAIETVTQKSILDKNDGTFDASNKYIILNTSRLNGDHIEYACENYESLYSEFITDKIFLPDVKQFYNIIENDSFLGNDSYAWGEPTQVAVERSNYPEQTAGKQTSLSRTPCIKKTMVHGSFGSHYTEYGNYICGIDYGYTSFITPYNGAIGVRPAFFLKNKARFASGDGTLLNPYIVGNNNTDNLQEEILEKTKQNNPVLSDNSPVAITLGEQEWIAGWIDGIYNKIPETELIVTSSNEDILPIISQDSMCMSPITDGDEYFSSISAFVKGAAPGTSTLTFYCQGKKLGTIDVTVEAVIADTISDETILKAEILSRNSQFDAHRDYIKSPAVVLNNALMNNSSQSWAAAYMFTYELSKILSLSIPDLEKFDMKSYYEAVLMDVLENDNESVWSDFYITWGNIYGGYNEDIVQKIIDEIPEFEKYKDTKLSKETDIEIVLDTIKDTKGEFKDIKIDFSLFDTFGFCYDTLTDNLAVIDEIYAYSAITQEKIDVLKAIQEKTSNAELAKACESMIKRYQEVHSEVVAEVATSAARESLIATGKNILELSQSVTVDLFLQVAQTTSAAELVKSYSTGKMIMTGSRLATDLVINSTDISKNIFVIAAYSDIENEIKKVISSSETAFEGNKTYDNAVKYIASADVFKAALLNSCDLYIKFVKDVESGTKGLEIAKGLILGEPKDILKNLWQVNAEYNEKIKQAEHIKSMIQTTDFYDTYGTDIVEYISHIVSTTPSAWAQEYVDWAIANNLLPYDYLRGNYQNNITRAEFCTLLTFMIQEFTGKNIEELQGNLPYDPKLFSDSYYDYVYYMASLGIVNGVSETEFNPLGEITREEAAVMLYRAAKVAGCDVSAPATNLKGVSNWATDGVNFVVDKGIMNGTDVGFEPQGKYTKEQAITTFVRFIENLK